MWTRTKKSDWIRVIQKPVKKDKEGNTVLRFDEVHTTQYKSTCTNVDGTEIACYAESEQMLAGLKRLHIHAVID